MTQHMCDMTHRLITCVTWLIHMMCVVLAAVVVTRDVFVHRGVWDTTHHIRDVAHGLIIRVTWLIYTMWVVLAAVGVKIDVFVHRGVWDTTHDMCDMTPRLLSFMRHGVSMSHVTMWHVWWVTSHIPLYTNTCFFTPIAATTHSKSMSHVTHMMNR